MSLTRVAPELPVDKIGEALDHYERCLGFEVAATTPRGDYAIVERDDIAIHLFERGSRRHSPASIHVFTNGLDELYAELVKRGARVTQDIVRQPWGNRDFRVLDLSGNTIKFTENAE